MRPFALMVSWERAGLGSHDMAIHTATLAKLTKIGNPPPRIEQDPDGRRMRLNQSLDGPSQFVDQLDRKRRIPG